MYQRKQWSKESRLSSKKKKHDQKNTPVSTLQTSTEQPFPRTLPRQSNPSTIALHATGKAWKQGRRAHLDPGHTDQTGLYSCVPTSNKKEHASQTRWQCLINTGVMKSHARAIQWTKCTQEKALSHFPKALFTVGHTFDLIPTAFSFAPCRCWSGPSPVICTVCGLIISLGRFKMLILQRYHHIVCFSTPGFISECNLLTIFLKPVWFFLLKVSVSLFWWHWLWCLGWNSCQGGAGLRGRVRKFFYFFGRTWLILWEWLYLCFY